MIRSLEATWRSAWAKCFSSNSRSMVAYSRFPAGRTTNGRWGAIDGLPILSEWPTLDRYFEQQVIGGPNHFIVTIRDYESFSSAIARKLLQEITGPGIS